VGLSSGFGLWQIAGLGTFLSLVVMGLLQTLEVKLGIGTERKGDAGKSDRIDDRKDDLGGRC
jgi:uncharacterized membrane protein YhiD involved in acid resistance